MAITSEREVRIVRSIAPHTPAANVPNGVDTEFFAPVPAPPEPDSLVFTGLLSYRPNIDAVQHLVNDIFPLVRRARPACTLTIVGGGGDDLTHLAGPGIRFTGYVPDLRPEIARAAVAVVPIRMGSGTRLKVVEALAMAKPMVSTTIGCEGIDVRDEEHLLIGDSPAVFAAQVLRLLDDPDAARRMGERGAALARSEYSWRGAADVLESLHLARHRQADCETVMSSVAVIIPCYNYAGFLSACVNSVLTQQGVDVEVLVIDDCSSDDTPSVGAALAADPRVTFRRHEHNIGHLSTYNEGLEWANADYTVLLSADDLLTPGALVRAASVMDQYPSVGMVYGRALRFESHSDLPTPREGAARPQVWRGADWIERRCRGANSTVASPEVTVRTSCYKELGGYRLDLPHSGDLEMWLRIAGACRHRVPAAASTRPSTGCTRRACPATTFGSALADIRERKAAFDVLFDEHGRFIAERGRRCGARGSRPGPRGTAGSHAGLRPPAPRHRTDRRAGGIRPQHLPGRRQAAGEPGPAGPRRVGPQWSPWVQFALPSVYIHLARRTLARRRMDSSGV